MAKVNNPSKAFLFQVFIAGIDPFTVQDLKQPDYGFNVDEHGDSNFRVKTAGQSEVGMMNMSKIINSVALDQRIWDWVRQIQNTITGGGALPDVYKELIVVQQLGADGISVIQTWTWEGCWPQKINGTEFSRMKSENTIHSIDFCVDRLLP